jgi:hypothetical protein
VDPDQEPQKIEVFNAITVTPKKKKRHVKADGKIDDRTGMPPGSGNHLNILPANSNVNLNDRASRHKRRCNDMLSPGNSDYQKVNRSAEIKRRK